LKEKQNPYEECPIYETNSFILRFVLESDAEDLLKCYSDPASAKIFNSDNCTSNFIYHSLEEMKKCIQFWIQNYENQCFIRFSIIDKKINKAVGAIECFAKQGTFEKNFGRVGVLRIDLVSEYETKALITEILNVVYDNFYEVFEVQSIITKAIPEAEQRIEALRKSGYIELNVNPIMPFDSYYIRVK
jgi:[ribosomal protein S5]-alanine N-acetyltransferase